MQFDSSLCLDRKQALVASFCYTLQRKEQQQLPSIPEDANWQDTATPNPTSRSNPSSQEEDCLVGVGGSVKERRFPTLENSTCIHLGTQRKGS